MLGLCLLLRCNGGGKGDKPRQQRWDLFKRCCRFEFTQGGTRARQTMYTPWSTHADALSG